MLGGMPAHASRAVSRPRCNPLPSPCCSGDDGEPFAAGCAALTERHILLGMPSGVLAFYDAADCCLLSEYRHSGGAITAAYPNADGSM